MPQGGQISIAGLSTTPPAATPPPVDYAALAKAHGAVDSQPGGVSTGGQIDYAALAKQHGAVSSAPPPAPAATPPPDSALSRFGQGFMRTNPVSTAINIGSGLLSGDWKNTIEQGVFQPIAREAGLAKEAFEQGRPLAAVGHAVGSIPLIGPPVAATVERAASGDVAGAAGEATGMGMTMGVVKPAVEGLGGAAADVGRQIPGVSDVMQSAGERADRFATSKMTRVIAPAGGPNKANLTAVSQRIAPQLNRAPELQGVGTAGGLRTAIEGGLDSAREGLDQVLDANLMQTTHPIAPIIQGLEQEQSKLVVKGDKGAVVPIPRQDAHDTLESMVAQLKQMGDNASYEDLRNLRQSWDEPAAGAKIYAKTEAEFAQKSVGQAYANGASVLRDYLANQEPEAAKANAKYSLFVNAHKVLAAAEQAGATASPGIGEALITRAAGVLGAKALGGGALEELIGMGVAPLLNRGLSSIRTGFKVKVAQQFAKLADALTSGKPAAVTTQAGAIKQMLRGANVQGRFVGQAPPTGDDQEDEEPVKAATPPPGSVAAATPPPR